MVGLLLSTGCEILGQTGPEETDAFLVVLKNNTLEFVSIGNTQTGVASLVGGLDDFEITLYGAEGDEFGFFTTTPTVSDTIPCALHLPRHTSPARQVDWSGNALTCFFW
jgi:hypothetical protein